MNMKKIIALVCAVVMLTTVAASAEWQFAGYDTTNPPFYGKIYNEVIDGDFTSKQRYEDLDPKFVEWKFEGYELQYPHAGYERLYLEGNAQAAITRTTNLFPQWETRFCDFMWEVCGDHTIYQRQQTKINNAYWAWDFGKDAVADSYVFVPTTRKAEVVDEFKATGIANLDNEGNFVYDEEGKSYNDYLNTLYNDFGAKPKAFELKKDYATGLIERDAEGNLTCEIEPGTFFHAANLSQLDMNNEYVVSDFDIACALVFDYGMPATKYVTGPSYYGENGTKDVAAMYLKNKADYLEGKDILWNWDADTVTRIVDVKVDWTKPIYEMQEPYDYYQYLIINDVVMDGHNDTPRIFRFTGGKATPDVEWRYAFVEGDYPFNVVEQKFIRGNDGKMVEAIENDLPVFRFPTGEFGNSFFKVTDTEVQYWVKDDKGEHLVESKVWNRTTGDFGGGYAGFTGAAGFIVE